MTQLPEQGNSNAGSLEWLDMKQAAAHLGITIGSTRRLVRVYCDELLSHLKSERSKGRTGKKTFITKQGLVVLATIKDRGGRGVAKESTVSSLQRKKKVVENAIVTADSLQALMQDPFIQLRVEQIKQQNELNELKNDVARLYIDREQAQQQLLALPESTDKPKEFTLRAMLRERINAYANAKSVPHGDVWARLYKQLYYRYQFNAKAISDHKKISRLDAIEQEGMLKDTFDLACELFKI